MPTKIITNHPTCKLYFVVHGPVDHKIEIGLRSLVQSFAARGQWVINPPQIVDQIDATANSTRKDAEVRTFGCVLEMYSAIPPWDKKLPKEIDKRHYDETEFLVTEFAIFSRTMHCEILVQLDDTHVGFITNGAPDRSLQQGLLDEWRIAIGL